MDEEDLVDIKIPPPDDGSDSENEKDTIKDSLLEEKRRDSDPGIKPLPMPGVNLLSRFVTFWWLNPLLSLGSKRPLEAEDFYGLRSHDTTVVVGDQLQSEWEKEKYNADNNGRTPSLLRAVIRAFGKGYVALGIFAIFTDTLRIVQPIFLGLLITYFNQKTTTTQTQAFLYALGVCVCSVLSSFMVTPFTFLRQCYGMRVRIACTSLVYNKATVVSLYKPPQANQPRPIAVVPDSPAPIPAASPQPILRLSPRIATVACRPLQRVSPIRTVQRSLFPELPDNQSEILANLKYVSAKNSSPNSSSRRKNALIR